MANAAKITYILKWLVRAWDWAKVPNSKVVAFFKAATVVPGASCGPQDQAIWNKEIPGGPWGVFVVSMLISSF